VKGALAVAVLVGVAALMWRGGASPGTAAVWLALACLALAIDPIVKGGFFSGIVIATVVAAVWSGLDVVHTQPNETPLM